jgi:hypothetical protein
MSYATIFTALLPATGICRFCGCTDERGCNLAAWPRQIGCGWADRRHTACTAPKCLDAIANLKPEADRALASRACLCGSLKQFDHAFCGRCFVALPWGLQGPLYETQARGFALIYADAKKFLAEQTVRLKGARA